MFTKLIPYSFGFSNSPKVIEILGKNKKAPDVFDTFMLCSFELRI